MVSLMKVRIIQWHVKNVASLDDLTLVEIFVTELQTKMNLYHYICQVNGQ